MAIARRAASPLLFVLLSATVSLAGTFSDDISSTTNANIINLFLSPTNNTTFSLAAPTIQVSGGATWTYTVSPDGKFAQFLTPQTDFNTLTANFDWIQFLEQPTAVGGFAGTPYSIDVQQVQFDWTTGTINAGGSVMRHIFRFGDVPPGGSPQYGNAGGPASFVGPAPEPSTVLVIALGALALGVRARRRTA